MKGPDLTGRRINKLLVQEFSHLDKDGRKRWKCLCDCGDTYYPSTIQLNRSNPIIGCPKCAHLKRIEGIRKPGSGLRRHLNVYQAGARTRNHEFSITLEEFEKLVLSDCHYCGQAPEPRTFSTAKEYFNFNGIDRKDNDTGYTIENCVPCCKTCNFNKRNSTYSEFNAWLDRITVFRNTK